MATGSIRVGIGGWTYAPWRANFYPPGLPHKRELEYAASRLTAIEIEATYYRLQKPETFARWRDSAPPGFVFPVKASRFCTNRKDLATAGEGIANFLKQGITELGDKLGPILWQFMATKRFDPAEFARFLELLPASHAGVPLCHVLEPRHESFHDPALFELAGKAGAAVVLADSTKFPRFEQPAPPLLYARLQNAQADRDQGYDDAALKAWASLAERSAAAGRDVFMLFINGAKERAPAAATALLERLKAK